MPYLTKILVERKKDILNPEALAVEKAAKRIDYHINELKMGKYFSYKSKKNSEEEVKKEAEELSKKLFSNPIIENYTIVSIEDC